jgi:acyl-CoA thioesterase
MTDAAESRAREVGDAMWARDRASRELGMALEDIRPGYARLSMRVRADMLNGHGMCHGGLIFALADSAFAFACNSHGVVTVASGCTIEFLSPAGEGHELVAVAEERSREGRQGVYDVDVRRADGGLVATFRGRSRAHREKILRDEPQRPWPGVAVTGIDGYPRGWVAVDLDAAGNATARASRLLGDLVDPDAAAVAVDIPIGIPEEGRREADLEAQRFVGARRSTVFFTPPRGVLEAQTYEEARRVAVVATGRSISSQAYALRGRILEADPLARADSRIVEVHPEVSFCELAGGPLRASKHTPEGLRARRALLEEAGLVLPERPSGVPEADLLDAAVAAWSAARYARGEARPLPVGHSERIGAIWR